MFENENPAFSRIKELNRLAIHYQNDNNVYFFKAKRGEQASILDYELFFRFISDEIVKNRVITSFTDIKNILNARTRGQNIKYSGDSKTNFVRIFDNVIVVKKSSEVAKLYKKDELCELEDVKDFVAVENGESFLNIDKIAHLFECENFIYIAGKSNTLTRDFLKSKRVLFFTDFDIEGLNIYESFQCFEKRFFIPENIEELFLEHSNTELYKKQIQNIKKDYVDEVMPVLSLIKKHSAVVEQEVFCETH